MRIVAAITEAHQVRKISATCGCFNRRQSFT
jgi:hypothetical protein